MEATAGVLVGSRHTAEDLWTTVGLPGLEQRTRLGPPGVDVEAFRQLPRAEADARALRLAEALEGIGGGGDGGDAFARNTGEAAEAVRWLAASEGPRVMCVGKLLVNKGVDLLLAGWPLVVRDHPGARLLIVGFGGYRSALERLWSALAAGDVEAASEIAAAGRALEGEGEPAEPLPILSGFLEQPPEGYAEAGRAAAGSVSFGGRLEHEEVAELLPSADAFVMPSTFPEAFGMVAAEAAACGVLPISAGHSGMAEVSSRLAPVVPEVAELISFPVNERAVTEISSRLNRYLALAPAQRREIGAALAQRVRELWSWQSVAAAVIAASHGELDSIPEVTAEAP
jgi:glycosyltransferase involved in cell wall biosynthesis